MYNPFTKHPSENAAKTWFGHLKFAWGIGFRLLLTSLVFLIHGLLPFIKIPAKINLTETALDLHREEENRLRCLIEEKNND